MISVMTDAAVFYESLGKRIRLAREAKGMAGKELAALAEVTPGAITRVERNQITPSVDLLVRIAQILGVSLDWLIPSQGATDPFQHRLGKDDDASYFSSEADEAARIIDSMGQPQREQALEAVRDIFEAYEGQNRQLRALLDLVEQLGGRALSDEVAKRLGLE